MGSEVSNIISALLYPQERQETKRFWLPLCCDLTVNAGGTLDTMFKSSVAEFAQVSSQHNGNQVVSAVCIEKRKVAPR